MTTDALEIILPSLVEQSSGAILDNITGEIIAPDDKAAIRRACGAVVDAYALAATKTDALRLQIDATRQPLIDDAMKAVEAALANDWDYQAARVELAQATAARDAILDGLNGALLMRSGDEAVSLDTGGALVTWGKARETWTLARPASWYGTPAARRELHRALADRAGDVETTIDVVLDWLAPTAKRSDLPPVRVTLRGEK